MKEAKGQSSGTGRSGEEKKQSPYAYRCVYCGRKIKTVNGFCRLCLRDGFDDVYRVTKSDNGWRWHEAWSKSHPNPVKYVDPLDGLAMWRMRNFGKHSCGKARPDVITRKMRINDVKI